MSQHSKDKNEKFMQLRANGHTLEEISAKIDVTSRTLVKWNALYKVEIAELEEIREEEIRKKYKLSVTDELEAYGGIISEIRKELMDKDYKKIKSMDGRDLLTHLLKLTEEIRPKETDDGSDIYRLIQEDTFTRETRIYLDDKTKGGDNNVE